MNIRFIFEYSNVFLLFENTRLYKQIYFPSCPPVHGDLLPSDLKGITTRHYINFFCCIYMKYTIICHILVCLKKNIKISICLKCYIKHGMPADPAEFSDLMN